MKRIIISVKQGKSEPRGKATFAVQAELEGKRNEVIKKSKFVSSKRSIRWSDARFDIFIDEADVDECNLILKILYSDSGKEGTVGQISVGLSEILDDDFDDYRTEDLANGKGSVTFSCSVEDHDDTPVKSEPATSKRKTKANGVSNSKSKRMKVKREEITEDSVELGETTIQKHFPSYGTFTGTVVGFEHNYYKVSYEDGDEEDMKWPQLLRYLQGHTGESDVQEEDAGESDEDDEDEEEDEDEMEVEKDDPQFVPVKQEKKRKPPQRRARAAANVAGRSIEQIYQKKSQLEHILLRPDSYVGSTEKNAQHLYIYDKSKKKIVQKTIIFVPGLYKIFDEIIVNAYDNKQRDPNMSKIKVNIDQAAGRISVWNNGQGIPVVIHREHNIYVPELIFGHLLTGSNFDDDEKKTVGGRNGYGAKLTNIFSKEFIIETADSSRGKRFRQVFRNNMQERGEPVITDYDEGEDFTQVTFIPDLQRFKLQRLDSDFVGLLMKRVYDVAGCSGKIQGLPLTVVLNDKQIPISGFTDYLNLYEGFEAPLAYEEINDRWEVGIGLSDGQQQQISFVNGICTIKGGQHVKYVAEQVVKRLAPMLTRKNSGTEVKSHLITCHLSIYINCLIENPAFDSQTKETLTTRPTAFGSDCLLTESFLKTLEKSPLVDSILTWTKFKQNQQLKKTSGRKLGKLSGIPKLDDANYAGTQKAEECTLILTEGDSAKSLAVSGLAIVGRDYYGVFPLKGKPLNVREASHKQIMNNEEIQNIVKIMGLNYGTEYTTAKGLRYGHVLIMTDQDQDGSHIKGLLLNAFHHFWPSLLKVPNFLQQFITPIVKCKKGKKEKIFYTLPEYEEWKRQTNDGKGWSIKYYKGLGTSTAKEARDYFSDLNTHRIDFEWKDEQDGESIELAFSKKKVDDRKEWLQNYEKGTSMDYAVEAVPYDTFIKKELVLFSLADCVRSIPCVVDGMKPSQRKVLFACFKRRLTSEIKVAQLAGYVSEQSAYHHGEMSLTGTIIGMAQNFVGSNNINLLFPSGQFGTRLLGGKDSASPRYVFTRLEKIARTIFHPNDDPLLTYLDDDGKSIEPEFYVPVIPMILANGSEGIGTGWSSSVPCYNPRQIIENLKRRINEEPLQAMKPWYRGFIGPIRPKGGGRFCTSGIIKVLNDRTVHITELPIKVWTQNYKQFLESQLQTEKNPNGVLADFIENHTDTTVDFKVTFVRNALGEIDRAPGGLTKFFKLDAHVGTTNMHLFNNQSQIVKYDSALDIMETFYIMRLDFYKRRKDHMVATLELAYEILENKVRFVLAVVEGRMKVSNRKKKQIVTDLKELGFKPYYQKDGSLRPAQNEEESLNNVDLDKLAEGYNYLMSMKLWSLTLEKVEKLRNEQEQKAEELRDLKAMPIRQMWVNDLDAIEEEIDEMESTALKAQVDEEEARKVARGEASSKRGRGGRRGRGRGRGGRRGWKARGEPMSASDPESSDIDSEKETEKKDISSSDEASMSSAAEESGESSDTSDSEDDL